MSLLSWSIIFLLVALFSYSVFSYIRIHGLIEKSAGLIRDAAPYERAVSGAPSRTLFIGDSTGVGVGASDSRFSLAGRYSADFPAWTVDNASVSGRKTAALIPVLKNLKTDSYQLVVIQIGGNDIVRFSPLPELARDIETVLREADRVATMRVILITSGNVGNAPLLPRPLAFLWQHRTQKVRALFMAASEKTGARYVDLYQEKSTDPFAIDPYRYHAADLFHPSADGYALWYEDFKQALP